MFELSYLQVELTGKCDNACPLCLPAGLRTGVDMSWGEAVLLRRQIEQYCADHARPKITFAGYGNPVDHPRYGDITELFGGSGHEVTITCRVEDLLRIWRVNRVNVSISSLADAEKLLAFMNEGVRYAVVPHVVLVSDACGTHGEGLLKAIDLLVKNVAFFEKISVARAVVLCDEHRKYVGAQNFCADVHWKALREYAANLCDYAKNKLVLWDENPRKKNCAWRNGGLLVNSRLQLLPCCNLPCVGPMADLHGIDLKSFLEFDSKPHNKYGECSRCPDIGPRP